MRTKRATARTSSPPRTSAAPTRALPTWKTFLPRRIAGVLQCPWWYFVCAPGQSDHCLMAHPPSGGWGRALVVCTEDLAAAVAFRREERWTMDMDPARLAERRLVAAEVPPCPDGGRGAPVVATAAITLPAGELRIACGRLHRTNPAGALLFIERCALPAGIKYLRFEALCDSDRFTAPIAEVLRAWRNDQ